MLQNCISSMIAKGTHLTNMIQVMLFRRTLPCQLRASRLWEFNPEEPRTLKRIFGTMHEDIWKHLFKTQKEWPEETEDAGFSTTLSAPEVIENFAERIFIPLFNDNRNWSFCVIYRAGRRRRPGLRVRRLCPKTQHCLY